MSRIDPNTDAVTATIEFPFIESVGTLALAAGIESLWVGHTNHNEIWRVDPATNEITDTVTLGETDAIDCLVFAHGSLWATVFDGEKIGEPGVLETSRLLRVDPETGDIVTQFQTDQDALFTCLAAAPGAVWLATTVAETQRGVCGGLLAPLVGAIG